MPIKAENEWVYPAIGRTRAFRSDVLPQHTVNACSANAEPARDRSRPEPSCGLYSYLLSGIRSRALIAVFESRCDKISTNTRR